MRKFVDAIIAKIATKAKRKDLGIISREVFV